MESCIVPKDIVRQRFLKQQSDGRASRLSFSITRQTSRFQGNVSLIKVNCKTINTVTNILPLENDTLENVKGRLLHFIEKGHGYKMTDKIKESFHFQLDKSPVPKEDEELALEEILKKCCEKSDQCFEGDVINIGFLITDLDVEYQMIKDNLDKFKTPSIIAMHLVKQKSKKKGKMKNRLLKIEENADDCLITLYNIRGEVKEAYPIQVLKAEVREQVRVQNATYFPLSLSKYYEDLEEEQRDASEELAYFTAESELLEFLGTLKSIKDQQVDSDDDMQEDNLEESIRELGGDEIENLDEEVEVGQVVILKAEVPQKGNAMTGPVFRIASANLIENRVNSNQGRNLGGILVGFSSMEVLSKMGKNGRSDKDCVIALKMKKAGSACVKLESAYRSSVIGKAVMEKKELDLEGQEFEVKVKGLLGIYYKRLLRLSDDFEFHFFKKEKEKYLFTFSVPINNLAKVVPKKGNSFKVYFYLKADKKQQKPIKVGFNDMEDLKKFFRLSKKIAHLFNSSTNSFQTEKERTQGEKLYPWLMGPKGVLANVHYEHGKITTMQFNVINLSHSQEPQLAHLDLMTSTLTLKSVGGTSKKKLNIRNILYCGTKSKDMRSLSLILKNNKHKLLFSDNRSRLAFESAIYNTILSQYRIPSKKPFDWEPINVFSTTFNAGFGAPPADLSPWLGKTMDCDLIAIGMQEANTAEWVQALQLYYSSDKFTLVSLVTMWKMLLCVFVSSKYSNYITNVEVDSKATGIAKVIGNKGGVAVSFRLLESSFCFLSCHLAAQPERMPTRKANFYNLLKSIRLGDESLEIYSMHDYFFFMGDTNFRLDYDFFKAVETINKEEYLTLLPHDQYKKAREEDNFITSFSEGKITFKPTYRRNREDTGYSNKRNQAPSWTDRIFFKSRPGHPVTIREYNSAEMFFLSDHRPVYGIYGCEVQPPYLPRTPIYSRPSDQKGVIKIKDLELDYDFGLYGKMGDFESPLAFPLTISVGFRSAFLHKGAVSMPMELKEVPDGSMVWNEEMLPLLYTIIPDYRYLRSTNLLALVKFSETVTGQADISLEDLMLNQGRKTEFKVFVYFYGRCFGSIRGNLIYDLN